jgi:hypothetical protein
MARGARRAACTRRAALARLLDDGWAAGGVRRAACGGQRAAAGAT